MRPISLEQLAAVVEGKIDRRGASDRLISRVVTDSRDVQHGDLFVALPGTICDGAEFSADAACRGAAGVMVQRQRRSSCSATRVLVEKPLKALWDLAAWNREQSGAIRIGVTGSFGKTTTRQMIHRVLGSLGPVMQSPRNFNNQVGLPVSLLGLEADDRFAVLEVAASGPGEMGPLGALVDPHAVVLTGIGRAHLGGFGSVETLAREKGRLLEAVAEGGLVVVPESCTEMGRRVAGRKVEVVTVGEKGTADIVGRQVFHEEGFLGFRIDNQDFRLRVAGRHFLTSALAAVAVARWLGMADQDSARALASFRTAPGRCHVDCEGPWTVIDDTYNASPESVLAACHLLGSWKSEGRRILVLGDMAELGDEAGACHAEVGVYAARCGIDQLWAVGAWAGRIGAAAIQEGMSRSGVHVSESMGSLKEQMACRLEAGDVVLVKGARRERMERVVRWLKDKSRTETGVSA